MPGNLLTQMAHLWLRLEIVEDVQNVAG